MAISLGPKARQKAEINLTPMIDVLLVLLIIFMLITPYSRGLDALIPQPSDSSASPDSDIVITVRGDGTVRLNQETLDLPSLRFRLSRLFERSTHQAIFLRGEKEIEFGRIAEVIDLARSVGVFRIGLMTN